MISRNLTVRDRLNLARTSVRAIQVWTYAAGLASIVVAVFADPQHRLIIVAFRLFTLMFNAITN